MISILMSSYNYETYMGEAIRSVLKQTWVDFELLVIDDGSKDGSMALARSFAEHDPRVRVLQHPDGRITASRKHCPSALRRPEETGSLFSNLTIYGNRMLGTAHGVSPTNQADVVLNAIRPLPMPGAGTDGLTFMSPVS